MENIKKQLEGITERGLNKMASVEFGTDDYYRISQDVNAMLSHMEKFYDIENRQCETALKSKSLDIEEAAKNRENDIKEMEIKQRNVKDTAATKVDRSRVWLDFGARLAGFAVGAGMTCLAIYADHIGAFPSKLGMNSVNKPRYF